MSTAMDAGGLRVACLTANEGVEQVELVQPRDALRRADAVVTLVAPESGEVQAFHHLDVADRFPVEATVAEVSVDDFDALLLPGGVANPDALRLDDGAVRLVRDFFDAGKPVAVICHGPWILVEADVVEGRTLTGWPSLETDVRNAGGRWVDQEVCLCRRGPNVLVSSRKPDDLPAFCRAVVEVFAEERSRRGRGDPEGAGQEGAHRGEGGQEEAGPGRDALASSPAAGVVDEHGPIPEPSEPG